MEGKVARIGTTNKLQDLRRKIYFAAKSDKQKRFWGLFCHVSKKEVLYEAYKMAKQNDGSPGIDGITFEDIEEVGLEQFIENIREGLINGKYKPLRNRKVEIPKESGKVRVLGIPTIKDRVVQGALKIILESIYEADFANNSYGYRPKKSQHQAIVRVSQGIMRRFTKVIDVDLSAYFDNVKHHILMKKIAKRINDPKIMKLLRMILKANGKVGVPQGGVISPLLSNIYLNAIDNMFGKAIKETQKNGYQEMDYCRFADDMVILVSGHKSQEWLVEKSLKRLSEELEKLQVKLNIDKTKTVDMNRGETFAFLGFEYRLVMYKDKKMVLLRPKKMKVQGLINKVKKIIDEGSNKTLYQVIQELNPVIRGWINYYRIGHCGRLFSRLKNWVEMKVRRYVRKKQGRFGFGWKEWSKEIVYGKWRLYNDYQIRYYNLKASPYQ